MPLGERYALEVPDIVSLWTGRGYFETQAEVLVARSAASNHLEGSPTGQELEQIEKAAVFSDEDVNYLNQPVGHETARLVSLIQGKLEESRVGNMVYKGMTSQDLLDTALALQMVRSLDLTAVRFESLGATLLTQAAKYRHELEVTRTHMQHGIIHTWGRQVIGWYAEVRRGAKRIQESREIIRVGKFSGEAGTNVNISPEVEDEALDHLDLKADEAPTQIISRDRHAQVALNMAVNAGTLGRIAGNIAGTLASTEVGEVREHFDPEKQRGSSSMPHKRNPELSERVEGLTRWTQKAALAVLESMKVRNERDISHSSVERFAYQDLFGTLNLAAQLLNKVIGTADIYPARMLRNINITRGAVYSPRLLNEMLERDDMPPRDRIYDHVRDLIYRTEAEDRELLELVLEDPLLRGIFTPKQIQEFFTPAHFVRNLGTAWKRLGLKDPAES